MAEYCTGPDTSVHYAPESGECEKCAATVAKYEEQSGRIFDPNGERLTVCDGCGELIQNYGSHEPVCDGAGCIWDPIAQEWTKGATR